jgi:GT2 family glycosyltransferase
MAGGDYCRTSIVIISRNEGEYLGRTVQSILAALPPHSEVLVVDDWSTDGSAADLPNDNVVRVLRPPKRLGTVRARNFGARHARGQIIVFSDAHVEVPKGWFDPLVAPLATPSVGATGPVISMMYHPAAKGYGLRFRDAALNCEWCECEDPNPHPVPILGAGFFAMRRDVFVAIGGFDAGMILCGMEDPDLDIRLWTFGYECLVVPSVDVSHLFRGEDHWFQDWGAFLHNVMRYATIHFGEKRRKRLIECYSSDESLPEVLTKISASDAWKRRREIQRLRFYDDDWYFKKFSMNQ